MARGVGGKDTIWRRIMRYAAAQSRPAQESHVKVGILQDNGGSQGHDGITVLELGLIHEFGAPGANIPERSFIRRTFADKQEELAQVTASVATQFLKGMPLERALGILGAWGANAVKRTITDGEGVPPPLKPATIARKDSDRPLVDTGRLLNAISWKVWIGRERDARGRFTGGRFES